MKPRLIRWIVGVLALALAGVIAIALRDGERPTAELDSRADVDRTRPTAPLEGVASNALDAPGSAPSDTQPESARTSVELAREKLVVRVVEPSGAGVAGAHLALFRAEDVLDSGATDGGGVARFEQREGSAEYALLAPGWALARGVLELGSGERTLTLQEGDTISGSVQIDGAPPKPPLTLDFDEGIPALPTEVFNALGGALQGYLRLSVRTRDDGTFAFRGLLPDTSGTIRWREPCFIEGRGPSEPPRRFQSATAPERDLQLVLIAGVEVRLRVVDPSGAPVPGAPVSVSAGPHGFADFEGRFVDALLPPEDRKGSVEVAHVGGIGARKHPVLWPESGRGVLEVGDLSTSRTRPITVLVQDANGAPIRGARIWPELEQRWFEARSDESGSITLDFGEDEHAFYVEAAGYVRGRFFAPDDAVQVVAKLEKQTLLEVEVAGTTGPQRDLTVEVTRDFSTSQAATDPRLPPPTRSRANPSPIATIAAAPDADGRWRIAGLPSQETLRVVLRRSGGPELDAQDVAPLAPGEHRVVQLRLPQGGRSFRVRVSSPDGAPLSEAGVDVTDFANGGSRQAYAADESGEVELTSMFGERFTLVGRAEGFPSKPVLLTSFPTERVDIVLEPAHSIEVELVWPDGRPFEGPAQVSAMLDQRLERATTLRPGFYRIDHLPGAEVSLWISAASAIASPLHDARIPKVRVAIGHPGVVHSRMNPPDGATEKWWSVALAQPGSATDLTRTVIGAMGPGELQGTLNGIAFGTYDAWLEQADIDGLERWTRVGTPIVLVLDAQHPIASIVPHP